MSRNWSYYPDIASNQHFLVTMKLKTFLIVGAVSAVFSASAADKGGQSSPQKIEDIRRSFFMPVATNSLCPEEYRVSAERFAAFRSSALTYLDYLQATAESAAIPQFEKARTEITGTEVPASFLAKATKIFRKYSPSEARSLFCARLNRMFEADIIETLMHEEQKRRSEVRSE